MQLSIGFVNDVRGYLEPHNELYYKEVKGVPERIGKNRKDLEIKAVEAMENYLYDNPKYNGSNKKSFSFV